MILRTLAVLLISSGAWAVEQITHGEFPSGHTIVKKNTFAWVGISARETSADSFNRVLDPSFQELSEKNKLLQKGLEVGAGKEFFLWWRLSSRSEGNLFYATGSMEKSSTRFFSGVKNSALFHERLNTQGATVAQSLHVNMEAFNLIFSPYFKTGLGYNLGQSKLSYSVQDFAGQAQAMNIETKEENLFYLLSLGLILKNNEDGFIFGEVRQETFLNSKFSVTPKQNEPEERFFATEKQTLKRPGQRMAQVGVGFLF